MCLLTFYPEYVQPDIDALTIGAMSNDDGHGYAIVSGDRIIIRHGMDADRVISRFKKERADNPDGPALFHSRWSTGGRVGRANCHPYPVGGDRRMVVAHNGVMPLKFQPRKGDSRSDTRIFAEDHLPKGRYGHLDDRKTKSRIGSAIGNGKLVILTTRKDHLDTAYLINEHRGLWDGDIWYSNTDYCLDRYWSRSVKTESVASSASTRDAGQDALDEWLRFADCELCLGKRTVDLMTAACSFCGGCFDCLSDADACQCYVPERYVSDVVDSDDVTASSDEYRRIAQEVARAVLRDDK